MSDLVDPSEIEELVGASRHPILHIGRADTSTGTFYILHSEQCLNSGVDLRRCRYSEALDLGIHFKYWVGLENQPQILAIAAKGLFPGGPPPDLTS